MLFDSFSVKGLTLKNRIVMPPMCNYMSDRAGLANDWHFIHYASRAIGGAGLIIQEATGVEDGGRISARDLGLWTDEQGEASKRIVDIVHRHGAKIGVQLNHAGRKSEVEYLHPVGPSAVAFSDKSRTPQELTKAEIAAIVDKFAAAAKRAVAAGYDVIEIHGAHGYLINQFLSPLSNQRRDEYGGGPENRARLLGEVVTAVRQVMPGDMPLFVRVSAHDYAQGGNTPDDLVTMLNLVKDKGVDVVHVSSGAVISVAPRAFAGYQIPFALTIKEKTGLPVIGGGLITEPVQAEQVIKTGVDLVFLGRELLREPYWPLKAAFVLGQETAWPEPYVRGKFL
ncbi:MAG: NADPH dehydrogenase NamA [Negativicutes bacterium]|nr:NADPH dehydrogenase NamA [Negativicutes bacterium]